MNIRFDAIVRNAAAVVGSLALAFVFVGAAVPLGPIA